MPHQTFYDRETLLPSLMQLMRSAQPYPISGVSLSPFDTNYYLMRGLPFATAHSVSYPLEGFLGPLQPLSGGCNVQSCGAAPAEFCRTLQCPALTSPTREGCRE